MVFNKNTKEKARQPQIQLLLVDRHCSHINLDFSDYADKYQIIVLVLPPHAVHQL